MGHARRLTCSLAAGCLVSLAAAQEPPQPTPTTTEANAATPAPGHSLHGETFNEGPRQRARLMPGMGKVHFPVTIASAEGQQFIDQGVAQLHTFYYLEAERSFRQAALLDPDCAMAYWGMAMANVNNARRARGFLKVAQEKAKTRAVSRREQLYLEALAAFHKEGQGADDKTRRGGLLAGFETIVQEFPGDLDARAWLAMIAWQNAGKGDGIGSRQAVDGLLDQVLALEPLHPGAHHYRIHLWDNVKPIRAELSAALYAKAAPGIAHAWHMPGHTYSGLKRYADAAYQQEGSARVDHAMMLRERVLPFEIHNYAHNNQWLVTSLSHVGRVRDALAVARDLVEQPRDPQKNGKNDGGSAQRVGRMRWMEVLTRYELWDQLIAATESGRIDWSDLPLEQKEKFASLGLAYAASRDSTKLAEQIAALKQLQTTQAAAQKAEGQTTEEQKADRQRAEEPQPEPKPAEQKKAAPPRPSRPTIAGLDSAIAELEGHALWLAGNIDAALAQFEKARAMRKEALARAYAAARRFDKAEEAARQAVRQAENQLPPLATLVEVLHAAGKLQEAQQTYRQLEPIARGADPDLPILQRLASIVAGWESSGVRLPKPGETPSESATLHRIDLATVGPLTWAPYPAEPFTLQDTRGQPWSLAEHLHRGRNLLVIFYLGGSCAHCMQQLQTFGARFEALKHAGTDLVAISSDDLEATRTLSRNSDNVPFPMPLLADPKLEVFRAYRTFDDFENQPLHGTFLIDQRGGVRFHRISADPFLDVEFIEHEAARVLRLVR